MAPQYQLIVDLLNARKKQTLLFAEASMSESQFKAFRRLFLNEFGKSGFEKELEKELERVLAKVLAEKQRKER